MRISFSFVGSFIGAIGVVGCGGGDHGVSLGATTGCGLDASSKDGPSTVVPDASTDGYEAGRPTVSLTTSHGSTIALTGDDSRLVVANHDVGTATVFAVDYSAGALPALTKIAEIAIGAEPSALVVHPDGDTAFVLSRKDQKLVKITGLLSTPGKAAEVAVGAEPTGLAMTPLGGTIWVANWVDGTLMGIASDTMMPTTTIDLIAALAASPYLGAGLSSRPALAHPRAGSITNTGDPVESEETIYVTEYFTHQSDPLATEAPK